MSGRVELVAAAAPADCGFAVGAAATRVTTTTARPTATATVRLADRLRANGSRTVAPCCRSGRRASIRIVVGVRMSLTSITSVLSWPSMGPGGDARDGGVPGNPQDYARLVARLPRNAGDGSI